MKKEILLAISILAAGPAMAGNVVVAPADPDVVTPPPVVQAWTGPYIGIQAGTGTADLDFGRGDISFDGGVYGVHAGYNFDLGKIVLGLEVDYNKSTIGGMSRQLRGPIEISPISHLKARVGVDMGKLMLYGVGGIAKVDIQLFGTTYSDSAPFYGVGAEYMITDKWSAGVEYLHHNFDDFSGPAEIDMNTIQARASYHF